MKKIASIIGALLFATAAQAQDCRLERVVSLPLSTLPDGSIAAPFSVNGKTELLAISLQAPRTVLDSAEVDGAPGGDVKLRSFAMGKLTFADVTVGTAAGSLAGAAGVIGLDTLRRFDLEFDFRNAQLNLFTQHACLGTGVVYWTDRYTVVPMSSDAGGHVLAQVTLDGKPANAEISTAPGPVALRTPGAVKALGIGAITLANPPVTAGDGIAPGADARIGLDTLSKLHLFFAFSENKLYATP